jgi:hypothetical protein
MKYSKYKLCICDHTRGTHNSPSFVGGKWGKEYGKCNGDRYHCECKQYTPQEKNFTGPIAQFTPR